MLVQLEYQSPALLQKAVIDLVVQMNIAPPRGNHRLYEWYPRWSYMVLSFCFLQKETANVVPTVGLSVQWSSARLRGLREKLHPFSPVLLRPRHRQGWVLALGKVSAVT